MDRRETDKEAKATKNTKNVWKWILGVGIVLMAIAFWGGFFNHNENFTESENATETATQNTDTIATDSKTNADTIMESVRDNK
ncbi:YrdB family protein [Dyadobacter sp. CY347]|uniref:YrdB family protein n=1 Tax=Dyadobacter sp. CY347 TaxID=2909336 RepID=UPI001F2E2FD4|nr:YrdB family protein [Dyadobacter sp. CY347]MCF2486624.1 YrdB family protein [Dyadobacter sp. CY347]